MFYELEEMDENGDNIFDLLLDEEGNFIVLFY